MSVSGGPDSPPILAVKGLTFRYRRADDAVIRDFTHIFLPGSLTAVTGPSGCGKSTLLYLLGLMLQPSRGTVLWRGTPVSHCSDAQRSQLRGRAIGFIFQDAVLDPSRTILDNVTEGALYAGLELAAAGKRAAELLADFGVRERVTHRPGEISGGQAQRVALCRALVKAPEVILADEPSGNLDDANADAVWDALRQGTRRGVAVVVATHDRRRAASADETIEL